MRPICPLLLLLFAFFSSMQSSAQPDRYILNGAATRNNCNCYTLTKETTFTSGSVWNKNKIDLSQAFDFTFNVFLGCLDANGADGMVFILQPVSTSIGTDGGGMGFTGIKPSIGIALDTWQNTIWNDPAYDHISIQKNGNVDHNFDLAGPVQASANSENIEDCKWHLLRISWEPALQMLRAHFDDSLRLETHINLTKDVFGNDPMVYWGFSSATGGSMNLQQFCTALNPKNLISSETSCILPGGNTITFEDRSESFAPITKYFWDFGDGISSNLAYPPAHTYQEPGIYKVKLAITGMDGCNSDTLTKNVVIGSIPKANFQIYDTCINANPRIVDLSTNETGNIKTRKWVIDANQTQTASIPDLSKLSPGKHDISLQVVSQYGCASYEQNNSFLIKDRPRTNFEVKDACANKPVYFEGQQQGPIAIQNWNWNFGDGQVAQVRKTEHQFDKGGQYLVGLWGIGDNGCSSDTVKKLVRIEEALAYAGKDTLVQINKPFTLHGSGNGSFLWSPAQTLSNASIAQPIATINNNQIYTLTVTTPLGCIQSDQVLVTVFNGPTVFIPNAFTPDNDRVNDVLKPVYKGVQSIQFYNIYNRWGELVYKTTDMSQGWDGTIHGKPAPTQTFIWLLQATDHLGKVFQMKGTVTLIR